MPTKKGGGARGGAQVHHDKENKSGQQRPSSPVNPDLDPAEVLLNMLTKKVRNLEKRKVRHIHEIHGQLYRTESGLISDDIGSDT